MTVQTEGQDLMYRDEEGLGLAEMPLEVVTAEIENA